MPNSTFLLTRRRSFNQQEVDERPEASPRLVVPQGGPGVFIVLPRAVIISSTLLDSTFEDLVPLKSDRVIGYNRKSVV